MTNAEPSGSPSPLSAIIFVVLGVSAVLIALAVTTHTNESVVRIATQLEEVQRNDARTEREPLVVGGDGVTDPRTARLRRRLAKTKVLEERPLRRVVNEFGHARDGSPTQMAWLARTLRDFTDEEEKDRDVRRAAIAVLGRLDRDLILDDPFVDHYADPDAVIRVHAVIGRARHGLSGYEVPTARLANDDEVTVRLAVAAALGKSDDAHATNALQKLVFDTDRDVSRTAAKSLARVWRGPLPTTLVQAASSEQPSARLAVAVALETLRSQEATNILAKLCVDPDWQVREAALKALGRARKKTAGAAAKRLVAVAHDEEMPRNDRFEALQALARPGDVAKDAKITEVAVGSPDPLLRLLACRAALAHGDARVLDALAELLDTRRSELCDDEDMQFIHQHALATLRQATGIQSDAEDARGWKGELLKLRVGEVDELPVYKPAHLDSFR